ncbi:MAG: glutamate synthase-related protein [Proteocatella sp.]
MSYSPALSSVFNQTKMRDPAHLCKFSGMCAMCTSDCLGTCEIGLSAVLGMDAVYPNTTGDNQIASEKNYPIDYSHFNINGRVFGAMGAPEDPDKANIYHVNLETSVGKRNPVKLKLPIILPALIKMNWQDYFGGAAMAGVLAVIGESAVSKDSELRYENGKVVHAPKLKEFLGSFQKYYNGYGQIILQNNYDDDLQGVSDYAIKECGAQAIEFKFGQSAKGTQPAVRLKTLEEAIKKQEDGFLVYPDPSDPMVQDAYQKKASPAFYTYGRLPMWKKDYLVERIEYLRSIGMKNVYFKMAGFDPEDLEHALRLAIDCDVDLVTFDGAGGGSGYSPCRMMNEWCWPTVSMGSILVEILKKLEAEGLELPNVAITGGIVMEDQVYKALALGAPYISIVGICRGAMAAAMSSKKVGEMIKEGNVPKAYAKYGTTIDDIFLDLPELRGLYGEAADSFSPGAVGVYSYLNRISFGLKHFAALNRKFSVAHISKRDVFPLTRDAKDVYDGVWMK